MNRITQIILNLIVGLVSFVFFVILLFPLDSMISDRLANLEKQTKGKGDFKIAVSNIDASLIFDTVFEDFRLFMKGQEVFYAPKIKVGLSLLPLISGTVNVKFSANYRKGKISGRVTLAEESIVDVDIDEVSFKELSFLTNYLMRSDFPVINSGVINGNVYFSWPQDLQNREAEINLKIHQAKTKSYFVKAIQMEVPALTLSDQKKFIEIDGGLDKGTINLNKFSIPGPDVVVNINGSGKLNRNNDIIRLNVDGKFSFSDTLNERFPQLAMLDGQKSQDNSYPLSVTGSLKKPKFKIGQMEF